MQEMEMAERDYVEILIRDIMQWACYPTWDRYYAASLRPMHYAMIVYPLAFYDEVHAGWYVVYDDQKHAIPFDPFHDMRAAWQVVTTKKFVSCDLSYYQADEDETTKDAPFYLCQLNYWDSVLWKDAPFVARAIASANSMPEAICKAALLSCHIQTTIVEGTAS